jgi:hypothetical protein
MAELLMAELPMTELAMSWREWWMLQGLNL